MWLVVSKALTRSDNATHVGRLCFCLRCRSVLTVNLPSWHPTPGVHPNWHSRPCFLIILNSRPHIILLYILLPMYIRVTPLHLLGLVGVPFWGTVILGLHAILRIHIGYARTDCRIAGARRHLRHRVPEINYAVHHLVLVLFHSQNLQWISLSHPMLWGDIVFSSPLFAWFCLTQAN